MFFIIQLNYKLIFIMILFYPIFHCSLSSFFLPVWYFVCSCVCLLSYWSILHSFLLILFLSPFFFQWSPVSWSLRASVYVYFSEPSSESSFHSFPPSVLLFKLYALWFSLFSHLYSITFHFYYNLSFYLQFYCDNYFSFFFVNNGKDACLHSGYSPIGICQLVNEKYDMDSSFQKFHQR